MLHTDFHTHTTFCDGKSTPREMVEAAYRMGMTDLGVSGHADFSMFEPGFGMDDEKLRQYTEELQELREEYRGKMNLYIGIELDGLGPVQKAEYAIGSTHALIKDGEYVCVDDTEEKLVKAVETLWHGDWYAFARAKQGICFSTFYAQSVSSPSRASIMTGQNAISSDILTC